jgi:molybdopterin-guanine dinucleotide biosynthesis protein A
MNVSLKIVVLAGGGSSRFGRDKASEPIRGQSSLDRVIEAAANLGPVWIVGGARKDHPMIEGFIPDLELKGGPVQAVVAAKRFLGKVPLLVLACDVPFIRHEVLKHLSQPLDDNMDARMLRIKGRAQPLLALYGPSANEHFETAYGSGIRAMHKVTEQLAVQWLEDDALIQLGVDLSQLDDFDAPEDLARLLVQNRDSEGSH